MTVEAVTYPCAKDDQGNIVDIPSHDKATPAYCLGCDGEMIARQGTQRRWHFAHKTEPTNNCGGEGVLHQAAKSYVKQGFERAKEVGAPYNLTWSCSECGNEVVVDATRLFEGVALEHTLSREIRCDLYFASESHSGLSVEIVVSHELDAKTEDAYQREETPVLFIYPTWETVATLATEARAAPKTLNIRPCRSCRDDWERVKGISSAYQTWVNYECGLRGCRGKNHIEKISDHQEAIDINRVCAGLTVKGWRQDRNKQWILTKNFADKEMVVTANFDPGPFAYGVGAILHSSKVIGRRSSARALPDVFESAVQDLKQLGDLFWDTQESSNSLRVQFKE